MNEPELDEPPAPEAPRPAGPSGAPPGKADAGLRSAVGWVAGAGLGLVAATAAAAPWAMVMGVAFGAALATANILLFIRLSQAFLAQGGKSAPFAALGLIKLLGLFFVVYLILKRGEVSGLALMIGYGALPIGIVLSTFFKPADPAD